MKLEEFKKKNRPRRQSVLFPFKSEIEELYKCGYSLKSIQAFLKENGTNTTFQNIHTFIKKELKEEQEPQQSKKPKKTTLNYTKEPKQQEEKESWGVKFLDNNVIARALEGDI